MHSRLVEFTPEEINNNGRAVDFWKRYLELKDTPMKVCDSCGKAECAGDAKFRRFVRVVLLEGEAMSPGNLALLCTECRPKPRPPRQPRRKEPALDADRQLSFAMEIPER
jgi:hypothetical protein